MITAKEAYRLACMWHRAFKNGHVDYEQYQRAKRAFESANCAVEWKASYSLYFNSIVWMGE